MVYNEEKGTIMFKTITEKTKKTVAVVGATSAVLKAVRRERKEIAYSIACFYPDLTKKEQREMTRNLLIFKINMGMIHT